MRDPASCGFYVRRNKHAVKCFSEILPLGSAGQESSAPSTFHGDITKVHPPHLFPAEAPFAHPAGEGKEESVGILIPHLYCTHAK